MLFLVIDHINTGQIDADQINLLKQTFGLYNDYTKEGKLKLCYAFADKPGIISVWDVESNEELQRILFLLPSLSIIDRTVKPLTDLKSLANVTGELQQIVSSIPEHKYEEKEKEKDPGK
jgi:muconolactone delta-isomerase